MTHTFTVKIDCGNAAFCDEAGNVTNDSAAPELARILREIADRIEAGTDYGWFKTIHDVNGNDVGRYALKPGKYVLKEV